MNATLTVVVDALYRQGRDNLAVSLVAEPGHKLPAWEPGAHVDVHLGNGLVRQYSLTGCHTELNRYLICVARERQSRGGSRYVHESLRPGQVITISPPRNVFPLIPAGKIILIAAGIGITPLYAMAEQLEAAAIPFVLHYYVRERANAAFLGELFRPFTHGFCEVWYSGEGYSPREHLPVELRYPAADTHLYLCGPEGFMAHIRHRASEKGWLDSQIHSEAFTPAPAPPTTSQDDVFFISLASTGQQWPVPAGKSIAAVLQENGVSVPLSCEMGMCGACLTPVKQGRVDHRDTVQSVAEKTAEDQQIALCCSRSLSRCIVIDL
ncbi:PDR/VanB family oxidoreductase [Acerihabitans sp. TG2]|uniref:PDR/VanB family oxidoreductase n=1 Tax=Acerihabitans sp. TG2 TaxID=3096008 RepID=UPI002B22372C|nr:PDR/VanB family oxidoreductase [Acerihabitans sp. TG2]MEA9390164.1 PDR/VanB family oxidoreductase [Acerihabitans sp. TG2]